MGKIFAHILLALLATGIAAGRPFTNTAGKTIEAEVAAATPTTVTLKLSNGTKAKVKLDTLSEPDREYVKSWLANKVPRLRVTPNLVRSNRDGANNEFFFDEDSQTQILKMSIEVENEDTRVPLGDSVFKYILIGRSVVNSKEYRILAVQSATLKLARGENSTLNFKPVKNSYDDSNYYKSGHKCIGYVLHIRRKSDDREIYSFASTPALERGLFNIVNLRSGDITDENFIKPDRKDEGGNGIIVVE